MKKIISLCAATLMTASALAIPALPIWRLCKQADGTFIRVKTIGDEHFNYAVTADGIPVLPCRGSYYYARIDGNRLVATNVLAHDKDQRTGTEEQDAADADRVNRLMAQRQGLVTNEAPAKVQAVKGQKKGLVILVQFADKEFHAPENVGTLSSGETDINTLYTHMLNQEGYVDKKSGAIGSVHDYFYDQSNGAFDLTFDVVGPITLPHPYKYYGERTSNNNDARAPQMVIDACNAVKGKVNFADYDWNGDKEVEQVYVVYAGEGEATGGDENTIWPHKYSLSDAGVGKQDFNGITVNTYACSNELIRASINGKERVFYMGIGTICHEFSHCLGLPDFYDTAGGDNVGTGRFDLMCSGSYNGGPESIKNVYGGTGIGTVPAGYTSYERSFMGWITPTQLGSEPLSVTTMKGLTEKGNAYVLRNPHNENEYYLFENRSDYRWDKELPAHGLLVLHVDYNARAWASNGPNSSYQSHQRMTFVPADDRLTSSTQDNDTYPIDLNNSLTGRSTPKLSFYTGNTADDEGGLRNIQRADDGTISFAYRPVFTSTGITDAYSLIGGQEQVFTLTGVQLNPASQGAKGGQLLIIKDRTGKTKKVIGK